MNLKMTPQYHEDANFWRFTLPHVALSGEDHSLKPIIAVLNAFALTDIHNLGENLGIAELQKDDMEVIH